MKTRSKRLNLASVAAAALAVLLSAACAPSVKVRSDADPGVDLRQYTSYDFFSQMGIESDNYSSLLGQHFRDAISAQMDSRGFRASETPQLLVNVTIAAEEKIRVNTYSEPYLYGGYYGRAGYGMYGGPWGYPGANQTTVRQYTEANVYIDLVDASRHKMVWQGVAIFTLTEKMKQQQREAVQNTVASVFAEFPVAPSAAQ